MERIKYLKPLKAAAFSEHTGPFLGHLQYLFSSILKITKRVRNIQL